LPALVIHGKEDPIIPNAKLILIDGLGHALPPETWPLVVAAIVEHAR
jgi:pimeloyl-ACP methyl ester carboxylesterase